jgi:hypothetical protein
MQPQPATTQKRVYEIDFTSGVTNAPPLTEVDKMLQNACSDARLIEVSGSTYRYSTRMQIPESLIAELKPRGVSIRSG